MTDFINETREALELLRGVPAVEFQPPAEAVIKGEDGKYHPSKTPAWVKFSTAFRGELKNVKGAALSVYISIGLHVNGAGKSWPSIKTICEETGYESAAVTKAIKKLRRLGLIRAEYRAGTSNQYTPAHVSFGNASTPPQNRPPLKKIPPIKSEILPPLKSENKEELIKKKFFANAQNPTVIGYEYAE